MSISSTDANLVAGEWAHVSFTYNKFTSNVNLFVNNTLVGSANDVFIDLTKTNSDFAIGYDMDNTGATSHFSGAVDDIQIYNRELTTGEIAYLSNSSNVDLFLKNQLVGHWSFEEFTTVADNFMDKSTFDNTSVVTSGNVSYGSQPSKGNTSIVFDGTNTMSASNEGFNTNYMSIGAWVKPTDSNTTFVEKDGVFSFGLNSNGLPDLKIGDSDTSSLKFLKNLNNSSLKSHLTFEENVKDSVGYTQAVATNTTFQTDSYNPSIGGSSMVLDGVDSYVNTGKILENINDPNQMTMGMWVNLQDLEEGKSYPLVSVNNGFEWWVDKNGDNAKLNYYQPGVVEFSIGTFSVADNVGTGNIVITTETDKTYSVALFTGELDMNDADDINKFKTVAVNVSGSITADAGVEQTIPFTVNEIYNYDDLTANTLNKANNGYLYVSVAGGELNESRVLVNNVVGQLGGQLTIENTNDSGNTSLTMTRMVQDETLFDYTTADSSYTSESRHLLGKITLPNGDKFYGPCVSTPYAVNNIGIFLNDATGTTNMRPNRYSMDYTLEPPANRWFWDFYYEPLIEMEATNLVMHINSISGLVEHINDIGVVVDGVFIPATNTSHVLPFQLDLNYLTIPFTINFDGLRIGPNRPLKFSLKQNNDSMLLGEFYINGSISILTPVITQTATYRPFENDIQISGTIFSTHNSFKKVYEPLVFANDVDAAILTEEYLKAYVSNSDNNVQGYTVEFAKDLVNEFGTYTTDKAINANGDLIDLVDGEEYVVLMAFEDNVGTVLTSDYTNDDVNRHIIPSLSTLRSPITTSQITSDGITVEGNVIPDSNNSTTFTSVAVITPLTNEEIRTLIKNQIYSSALSFTSTQRFSNLTSNDDIQLWMYMLAPSNRDLESNPDYSVVKNILMYDQPDGYETSNRVQYTTSFVSTYEYSALGTFNDQPQWDTPVNTSVLGHGFDRSHATSGDPIIKLTDIPSSVRSIYVGFYEQWASFNFKLELRVNGTVIDTFIDESNDQYTSANREGQGSFDVAYQNGVYGLWNIDGDNEFLAGSFNTILPYIIDTSGTDPNNYTIVQASSVNYANVYLYATDNVNPAHDDIDKFTISPEVPGMYITTKAIYSRFDEKVYVSGTAFTSDTKNITKVYFGVFSMDADLSDDATVKTFLETYGTSQDITVLPYNVGQTNEFPYTQAFTDLSNNALITEILPDTAYEVRMMAVDVDGGYVIGKPDLGIGFVSVRDVDWSQIVANTPDYNLQLGSRSGSLSGDGKTVVAGRDSNLFVLHFNDETQQWGKFNTDGSFTSKDDVGFVPHDLSYTVPTGTYASFCRISADGKSVVVSGTNTTSSGNGYVWQYDEATFSWGKYGTDGKFIAGNTTGFVPHNLSMSSNTNGSYGRCCGISANGKTVIITGESGTSGGAWVWEYNDELHIWGKYDSNGTFISRDSDGFVPHDLSMTNAPNYGRSCGISDDGLSVISAGQTSNSVGKAFVWQYSTKLHSWGKYDTDGSFITKDTVGFVPHDLSMGANTNGNYGYTSSISSNGKTAVLTGESGKSAWVWHYNDMTHTWGKYDTDGSFIQSDEIGFMPQLLTIVATPSNFGHSCSISGDGRTVIVSAHFGTTSGGAWIWQYNETTHTWGRYTDNVGTFVAGDPHVLSKSSTSGYYGYTCSLSTDGTTALVTGQTFIWKGVDNGELYQIPFSTDDGGVDYPTTLKTTITSTKQTDDGIVFSGEVIPDSTNETTYYAIATTTNDLTIEQIRDIVNNTNYDYSSALTPVIVPSTLSLTDQLVPYVLDTTTTEPYAIAHSVSTGYANVYLYATDGVDKHDDIDFKTLDLMQEQPSIDYNPRVTVPVAIYSPFYDTVLVSGAVFSAQDNVTVVYPPVAFKDDVDLSDVEALKTFFSTYVTPRTVSSYTMNHVEQFKDVLLQTAYTDLSGNTTPIVEGEQYNVRMYALTDDVQRWAIGGPISQGAMSNYDRLFHFDMRDSESYDGTVSAINDLSPAGRAVDWQGTKEVVQLNGHDFVAFQDVSTSYLQANDIPYNNYNLTSILVVNIPNSSGSAEHIFTHGQRDTGGNTIRTMSDKFFFNNSLSVISGSYPNWLESGVTTSELHNKNLIIVAKQFYESDTNSYVSLRICEVDTTNVYHVENSNIPRSSTLVVKVSDHIRLGTALTAATAPCDARIGELIMYAGMLNEADELAEIERLRNKWKVGGSAKSAGVSYLSTLRTSVTAVSSLPNEEIKFTGSVIPDSTYDTTYYVVATTVKNLTDEQVRELVMNPDYAEGVKTGVVLAADGTLSFTDEPLPNVIDTSSSAPYSIHSSKSVNTAHVYMYAKDAYTGVKVHEDIDSIELTTTEVGPRVYLPTATFKPFENGILMSGLTAYTSTGTITDVYSPIAFVESVDLSEKTDAEIITFVTTTSGLTPTTVSNSQYNIVALDDSLITVAYTDFASNTTEILNSESGFSIFMVVVDSNGNKVITKYINTNGYLSVRNVDWSGVVADSPSYALNKTTSAGGSYGEKCAISADGKVALITGFSTNGGCGYVWRYVEETGWVEDTTNLNSSRIDGGVSGSYGYSCSISANGNIALITGVSSNPGCAYVWRYNTTTGWNLDSTNLNSSRIDGGVSGSYGISCDMSADGNVIIISSNIDTSKGEVYVWRYKDDTNGWVIDTTNLNSSRIAASVDGSYGVSCSLSSDGNIALVSGDSSPTKGCAYIWRYNSLTGWEVDTTNLNSTIIASSVSGSYGQSSAISADGNTVIVAAYAMTTASAYLWKYDTINGWEVVTNFNTSKIGTVTGFYGYACDISADGNTVVISGHNGANLPGDAYIWQNNATSTWTHTNISNSTAGVRYGTYCALSANGEIALVSGNYQNDTTQGKAFVWQGVSDLNSPEKLIPFSSSSTFQASSTLRTSIETASLTDTLTFTGEVIPDSSNATTYYALATIAPIADEADIRTMVTTYSDAVVSATNITTLTTLTNEALVNVLDTTNALVSPSVVNYANVYLYATDGDITHDDITRFEIVPAENIPHVVVSSAQYYPFENYILVSGSAFSYNSSVATIHACAFDPSVDLSGQTETQIKDYIVANSTGTALVVNQKIVGAFTDLEITTVFTDLVGGTSIMEDGVKYDLRVVVVDALDAKGMGQFVDKSGYLSVRNVDWSSPTQVDDISIASGAGGNYGYFCSISADGKTALVTGHASTASGCAYIWTLNEGTGTWENTSGTTMNIASGAGGNYGRSSSLSADGKTALITGHSSSTSGCAYIWTLNEDTGTWENTSGTTMNIASGASGRYGYSCSLSADGKTALVAGHDSAAKGCAYIWTLNEDTGTWENTSGTTMDIASGAGGQYGYSCSLSADGKTALVAGHDTTAKGCAYIWTLNEDTGTWENTSGTTMNIASGAGGYYGHSCSLSADGKTALVAGFIAGIHGGCAYIWTLNETTGIWENTSGTTMNIASGAGGNYGYSCSLSADGKTVLVTGHNTSDSGCAYIWTLNEGTGTWENTSGTTMNIASGAGGSYGFSCSISANGKTSLVTGNQTNDAGCAFIWQGIDNGEKYRIPFYGSSSTFQASSTLRTSIETASLTDTLTFTGEVIPDSSNATTYYALATTNPDLTNEQVRTMMTNPNYSTAIVSATGLSTNTNLTDTELVNVLDASNAIVSNSMVNYANVYLYATDGDLEHDDIDLKVIDLASIRPIEDSVVISALETSQSLVMALNVTDSLDNTKLLDKTSNNNDAVITGNSLNSLTYGEDSDGKYFEFDGVNTATNDTHINLDTNLVGNQTAFTFDITFKIQSGYSFVQNDAIYSAYGTSSAALFAIHNGSSFSSSTGLRLSFGNELYNETFVNIPTGSIQRHTWVFGNNEVSMYINGVQLGLTTSVIMNMPDTFEINGHWSTTTSRLGSIPMKVYGVNIFQSALTATQLTDLWNNNALVGKQALSEYNPSPHITISNVSDVLPGTPPTLTFDGSVFSSVDSIASVKAMAFPYDADLSDETAVKAYINANGTTISSTPAKNVVGQFTGIVLNSAHTSTDGYTTGTSVDMVTDNNVFYKVIVSAIDNSVDSNIGMNSSFVPLTSTKYRVTLTSKPGPSSASTSFRGTELVFAKQYLEPTEDYHTASKTYNVDYTYSNSSFAYLSDGSTSQAGAFTASSPYVYEITFSEPSPILQVYAGSTDGLADNNANSYDETITIEYWTGTEYAPHSIINWDELPDVNGTTKATSGDGYFPWQAQYNKVEAQRAYPLIGRRGKQIVRFDTTQQKWFHYVAYGHDETNTAGVSDYTNKTFNFGNSYYGYDTEFSSLGNVRVY